MPRLHMTRTGQSIQGSKSSNTTISHRLKCRVQFSKHRRLHHHHCINFCTAVIFKRVFRQPNYLTYMRYWMCKYTIKVTEYYANMQNLRAHSSMSILSKWILHSLFSTAPDKHSHVWFAFSTNQSESVKHTASTLTASRQSHFWLSPTSKTLNAEKSVLLLAFMWQRLKCIQQRLYYTKSVRIHIASHLPRRLNGLIVIFLNGSLGGVPAWSSFCGTPSFLQRLSILVLPKGLVNISWTMSVTGQVLSPRFFFGYRLRPRLYFMSIFFDRLPLACLAI